MSVKALGPAQPARPAAGLARRLPWHGVSLPVGLSAVALLLVSCGSPEAAAPSADSAGSSGGDVSVPDVAYQGAEADLPTEIAEPEAQDGTAFTVGWVPPTSVVPAFAYVQSIMEKRVEDLGGTFIAKETDGTPDDQVSDVNELLAQDADVIIIYPLLPDALAPSLEQAKKAGVFVLAVDTPPDAADPTLEGYDLNISLGRDLGSYELAKAMAEANPDGSYGVIGFAPPVPALLYQSEQQRHWADQFGLQFTDQIDAQDASSGAAATAMSGLLGRHPDVESLFVYNDVGALAAMGTARSNGNTSLKIGAVNGSAAGFDAIEAGTMTATVKENWDCVGNQFVNAAYNLVTDQNLPLPPTLLCAPTVVTGDNVDSVDPNP